MQNLQDPYGKIFGEIQNLLSELSKSDSLEDILTKENEINELYQKFSYLKLSQTYNQSAAQNEDVQVIDNEITESNSEFTTDVLAEEENTANEIVKDESEVHDIFDDVPEVEEVHSFAEIDAEEKPDVSEEFEEQNTEVLNNDVAAVEMEDIRDDEVSENKIPDDVADAEVEKLEEEIKFEETTEKLEPMQDSQFSFAMEKEEVFGEEADDDYEARLAEKENKLRELEEKRRQIVEFSKDHQTPTEKPLQEPQSANDRETQEKKFKMANIKGLKVTKSLFDDDHLEHFEESQSQHKPGSLLKNNVPTDYMEAPKPKPEFKLDLNDRIAFSQHLFNGSQSELNQVVTVLNSFTSLDKAQEFLSDVYYERDWKKVDNYAQRLWTLVENRFL